MIERLRTLIEFVRWYFSREPDANPDDEWWGVL